MGRRKSRTRNVFDGTSSTDVKDKVQCTVQYHYLDNDNPETWIEEALEDAKNGLVIDEPYSIDNVSETRHGHTIIYTFVAGISSDATLSEANDQARHIANKIVRDDNSEVLHIQLI